MNKFQLTEKLNKNFENIFKVPKSSSKMTFSADNFRIIIIKNNPLVQRKLFKVFSTFDSNKLTLAYSDLVGHRKNYMIEEDELFQLSLLYNIPFSHQQLLTLRDIYESLGNVKVYVSFTSRE